jgi:hypothetical protein
MTSTPVEAIIGLGLEVKGRAWDDLHARLDKHKSDWRTVEGSVERIGSHVENLGTRLLALGGAVGVGALIADFVRLEDQANRVALAIGRVTGGSDGFLPTGQELLGASRATGFAAPTLAQAIEQLQTRAGGTYLAQPGGVQGIARALGQFAGAYNISPTTLAGQIGSIELFQRQNPGSTPQLLQQLAAQAKASGMAGQTGLFTQVVSGSVAGLISQHPASAGPGANLRLGAMYGAAQSVNPAFRDPSVFGQAIQSVDQSVTNAYTNPRLQAMMQMAGVGYWEQRGGLAGPNGPAIARKILAWSAAQYGDGTIAQDMFLRSNFGGNVSADFLKALAAGHRTQDRIAHAGTSPHALSQAQGDTAQRSRQYQHTPGAAAQRGRSAIEEEIYGLFGQGGLDVLNWVTNHPFESIAGAYIGKKALGFGGRALGRSLSGRFAGREAAAAGDVAADMARGARGGRFGLRAGANLFDVPILGDPLARGARAGATAAEIGSHANLLPRGAEGASAAARAARLGSRALPFLGPAGDVAAFFLDDGSGLDSLPGIGGLNAWLDPMGHGGLTDTTWQDSAAGQRVLARRRLQKDAYHSAAWAQQFFGKNWWTNPKAIREANRYLDRHYPIQDHKNRRRAHRFLTDPIGELGGELLADVGGAKVGHYGKIVTPALRGLTSLAASSAASSTMRAKHPGEYAARGGGRRTA